VSCDSKPLAPNRHVGTQYAVFIRTPSDDLVVRVFGRLPDTRAADAKTPVGKTFMGERAVPAHEDRVEHAPGNRAGRESA